MVESGNVQAATGVVIRAINEQSNMFENVRWEFFKSFPFITAQK